MKIFFLVAAVMAALLWIPAAGQSCTSALISLAPCLNYISGNSSTPSSNCCSQLASMVRSQPECLCTALNSGASSLGISINRTQALALPGACNVQTPPVSRCNEGGGSTGSPKGSPDATPSTPATPSKTPVAPSSPSNNPAANGSKTTTDDSSDGRKNKSAMFMIFAALIFASLFSFPSNFS